MSARFNEEYPFKLLAAHILHHAIWEQQHSKARLWFWGTRAFRDLCDYTGVEADRVQKVAVTAGSMVSEPNP